MLSDAQVAAFVADVGGRLRVGGRDRPGAGTM